MRLLTTIILTILVALLTGCNQLDKDNSEIDEDTTFNLASESVLSDYSITVTDAESPSIPGWFPNELIYDIPINAFDDSRSGHPWLGTVIVGYLDVRNSAGYVHRPTPKPKEKTNEIKNDETSTEADGESETETSPEEKQPTPAPSYDSSGSSVVSGLNRAEPFWIVYKVPGESTGLYWYNITTLSGKSGYTYLPRSESYMKRTFSHEKITPPRVVITSDDCDIYDVDGNILVPGRYGDIFFCKELENKSGRVYYIIEVEGFGNAMLPIEKTQILAEDLFYLIYLSGSRIYDYAGQFNNIQELIHYFYRVDWFLQKYPESVYAPLVLYHANYIAISYNAPEKAEDYRKTLIEKYPEDANRLLEN